MKKILLILTAFFCSITSFSQKIEVSDYRKNNLKVSVLGMGASVTSSPFLLNTFVMDYSMEYERSFAKRHSLLFRPMFGFQDYSDQNTSSSKTTSRFYTLSLGYRYYWLQFNNKKTFNGLYGGLDITAGQGFYRQKLNGVLVSDIRSQYSGVGLNIGLQTTVFKRMTIDIMADYRVDFSIRNSFRSGSLIPTLKIGYTF